MLCDVPSMAVSGKVSSASVAVKDTFVPRVTVAQKCLHVPYTCRSTHVQTPHYTHAASVGDALDAAADGASAAAAGRAPAAKPPTARAVQVVEVPQPARGPGERTDRSAAANHGLATADRRRAVCDSRRWRRGG